VIFTLSVPDCVTAAGSKNKIVNSFQIKNDNLFLLSCKHTKALFSNNTNITLNLICSAYISPIFLI
jgi:hypothetical protein